VAAFGAKAYFAASVFPKLREHQRKSPRYCWYLGCILAEMRALSHCVTLCVIGAMLVPGLVGCSPNSSFGRKVSKEEQEAALLEKLEGYYAWALREPRIAGLNSWHFNDCAQHPLSVCCCPALSALTRLRVRRFKQP